MKYIKLFEGFSDYMASQGHTLTTFYKKELSDFSIEEDILEALSNFESTADDIFARSGRWGWNRESRDFRTGHFSINVKVYNWPELEELESAIPGLGTMDDEAFFNHWYRFIEDQREMWQQDIQETFHWVKSTGFGGKSGGWLVIVPEVTHDEYLDFIEEGIQEYLDEKEYLDEEELADVKVKLNSSEWKRLNSLGLSQESGAAQTIIESSQKVLNLIAQYTAEIEKMDEDLLEIQNQYRRFSEKASEYFIEWLKGEVETNEGKKPKGAPDWHDSKAPDAKGKFKSLGIRALASWLIRTRGRNMQRINGSLNQQIVFNRNKNPSYAAKMKKVREEVKRQLGKNK